MCNKTDIDVFVLCGGFGKRLKKISGKNPKPMMKIGNEHFLDILLRYMASFGFRRFILGTGYRADVIKNHYLKKNNLKISIVFSREKKPLDTGGAIKNAQKLIISNPFVVLNGDSFCKFNPLHVLCFHEKKNSLITLVLKKISNGNEYGKVKIDKNSRIISFDEKNMKSKNCLINTGAYVFDKMVFNLMPPVEKFSLERDFFPTVAGKEIFGYTKSGLFIDIGTPERYERAKWLLKEQPVK